MYEGYRRISFINHNDIRFFKIVNELYGGELTPTDKPTRRTFSIMRDMQFKTMVHEIIPMGASCNEQKCIPRFTSCKEYEDNLSFYDMELLNKCCHKFAFFDLTCPNKDSLENLSNDNLLGYCIVHEDEIRDKINNDLKSWSYLTESIIRNPIQRSISFGVKVNDFEIGGKKFSIDGNYFSQQNAITNSCAHAAIKMAIRAYYTNTTAEEINRSIGINHIDKKGYKGLSPDEICTAIEKLTNFETYMLLAHDLDTPFDFLKSIYMSLESGLPVILLISLPNDIEIFKKDNGPSNTNGEQLEGHAVALTGFTFNKHSWYAYGINDYYLLDKREINPISSALWCDNFIIQDDNIGPFYLMPTRFLTDLIGINDMLSTVEKSMFPYLPIHLGKDWLEQAVSAIIVYPKKYSGLKTYFKEHLLIESFAYLILIQVVRRLKKENMLPEGIDFKLYFKNYCILKEKDNEEYDITSLIFRTLITTREKYLNSLEDLYRSNKCISSIRKKLPEWFCITEISIPELFWTNRAKVGEIITSPTKFHKNNYKGVILIRLPGVVIKVDGDQITPKYIEHKKPYQDLLEPIDLKSFI